MSSNESYFSAFTFPHLFLLPNLGNFFPKFLCYSQGGREEYDQKRIWWSSEGKKQKLNWEWCPVENMCLQIILFILIAACCTGFPQLLENLEKWWQFFQPGKILEFCHFCQISWKNETNPGNLRTFDSYIARECISKNLPASLHSA